MDQASFSFSIKPLSAHTGAEIRGIDLRKPVDDATRAALNQAFVDHAVLCVRDQTLSAPEFLEAMKLFGEIFPQHNSRFAVPDCPAIHYISNQDKLEDGKTYIPGEGRLSALPLSPQRSRMAIRSCSSRRRTPSTPTSTRACPTTR